MTDCFSFRVGKEGFSGGGAEWKLNWMAAGFLATWERPDIRARRSFFIFWEGMGGFNGCRANSAADLDRRVP